jgi:hypothetical protein
MTEHDITGWFSTTILMILVRSGSFLCTLRGVEKLRQKTLRNRIITNGE